MITHEDVWLRLGAISALRFTSVSRTGAGWSGRGRGQVEVARDGSDVLISTESGEWMQSGGKLLRFRNVYRWTRSPEGIKLEHLRFGPERPVLLADFVAVEEGLWRVAEPHVCRLDDYWAELKWEGKALLLNWTVKGPERDEEMRYRYW